MTARVAVSAATYAIDKPYDYLLPDELKPLAQVGMRVLISFGPGNRRTEGLILAFGTTQPSKKMKSVLALLDETPVLDAEGIQLALWMRERYFCTVYDAARAMLPAGLYFSLQDRYRVAPGVDRETAYAAAGRSDHARRILELLFACGGQAERGQIRAAFGTGDPSLALKSLVEKGILVLETSALRGVGDKTQQVASLAITP